jgi:uncharacterized membrane protein YgcG
MKKIVTLGLVVVVLIAGTVWAMRRHRVDPQVQKVLQMQQQAFQQQLTEAQRRAAFDQYRRAMKGLSDGQRQQVREQGFAFGQRRMTDMAAAFCKMSADQKTAFLNQFISDMQKRQKEREARRAADQAQGGSNGQGGDGSQGGGSGSGDSNAQGGRGGPGGGPGGNNRFDQQARNVRRLQMLDNTTPEQRAQMSVFRQSVQQQCLQQGVPVPRMGGGRF